MLIRFSFKNFKSVGLEPVSLEMVSSTKVRKLKGHICASSKEAKVLRNAVIYGGNAAGKSSVYKAFVFMNAAVLGGALPQEGIREYCRCGKGHAEDETTFDIQFETAGCVFDYGFSCILSTLRITSEWLYSLDGDAKPLFLRDGASSVDYGGVREAADAEDIARLDVYAADFCHEQSVSIGSDLFLSYLCKGRSFKSDSALAVFKKAFTWFDTGIETIGVNQRASSAEYYAQSSTLEQVAEVLSSFDTGINGLYKEEIGMDELDKIVPPEIRFTITELLKANAPRRDDDKFSLTVRNENYFVGIERKGTEEPKATVLRTRHGGSLLAFDFRDESDGTRRLFDFMDILFTRSKDKVFVIDELNRSFHPMLTQRLVELFNQVHASDDCQLVFTTHENDIMSYEYFRRDEIWFVERDEDGLSRLYPLDDFATDGARSDARLNKKYLEGRYGGVPVFDLSRARAALNVQEA